MEHIRQNRRITKNQQFEFRSFPSTCVFSVEHFWVSVHAFNGSNLRRFYLWYQALPNIGQSLWQKWSETPGSFLLLVILSSWRKKIRDQGIKVISLIKFSCEWWLGGKTWAKKAEGSPAKTWRAAPTTPSLWQAPAWDIICQCTKSGTSRLHDPSRVTIEMPCN